MLDVSAKQGVSTRIRLVIGDRQPVILQGLTSILGAQHDFDVVASSRDGTSCLEAIRNLTPDVALLADTLPDLTVTEILAIAKAENLPTRLVFFTELEANDDLTAPIAAGACSAISKYASPDTVLRSLRLITRHSVCPERARLWPTGREADGGVKTEKMLELLTHRERQIARLVSEGMSNKEIAHQLDVSPGTVKVHLYNIFQKLEITNRTVLATLALLRRPSGFGTLALAFLAISIADELKASEANDMLPNDDSVGHAGDHAEYEACKKAILRHLIVWESTETTPLTQRDFFAKLSQVTSPAAALEVLRAAEQSEGSKSWKNYGPVGSSAPNLPAPLLRGTSDTQAGGDSALEQQFPRLTSNPMSLHDGYGTFATLAGALIYALHDPHLAVQSHDPGKASIDSLVVAGENATTKLAAITHADANHVDNAAPAFPSHDSHLSSGDMTTGNESVAAEDARSQMSHGAEDDVLQNPVRLVDAGHDADVSGYGRDQLLGGKDDKNVAHRSPADSNSTSSRSAFDFASGSGRINLAAFGALAWLHMTAASKSIPPHTLAWIYNSATNETIVYVNPTDRVLDIGDRGLQEIHLQGNVSIAEPDSVDQREGAAVQITLEKLEEALTSAIAIDEAAPSKDSVHASIEAGESTLGTAGVWAILADGGSRFQFAQARSGLGASTKFTTSAGESADATKESDGGSAASAQISSIAPARSATATAAENVTSKSVPINADTGVSPTGLNESVQPGVAMADNADHGHSQHASEPGSAKAPAAESTEAGVEPGNGSAKTAATERAEARPTPDNGVDNDNEHHSSVSDGSQQAAKTEEPSGVEHSSSGHSTSTNAQEAAEIVESGVASADGAGRGNSEHASEPGSAKTAATEMAEARPTTDNGVDNDNEHHSSVSDGSQPAAKTAEPSGVEHSSSQHSTSANAPEAAEIVESGVARADGANRDNSEHASEPGSAKVTATELTETSNGIGNGAEHHAPASDGASAPAAETAAEPAVVDHGNSQHDLHPSPANAPDAAEIVESGTTADSTGRSHSHDALEAGSAKVAAAEETEADFTPGNGIGNGAEYHAAGSDGASAPAAGTAAEPAVVEHGNSGHDLDPSSANTSGTGEIVELSVATGPHAGGVNSQQAAQSATASEAAQPTKAASEIGGGDQEPVFRFDSEAAPSTLVPVVELKELDDPLAPHVPLGLNEDLGTIVKMDPGTLDEHAVNHGNSGPHQGIVHAPHDLLI